MAFTDLVERDHIQSAISEFKKMGRTSFLDVYGYGKAIQYFIEDEGDLFDAKAIFGVAFKFSEHGKPLEWDNFSGGEGWTNGRLRALGFKVVDERNWSDLELSAALRAYLRLLTKECSGQGTNKAQMRRELIAGPLSKRSEASIEMRMANFSAYFDLRGLPWISGYKPRGNIGTTVVSRLDAIFSGMSGELTDIQQVRVQAAIKLNYSEPLPLPTGNFQPKTSLSTTTSFLRDASVVAWVLRESKGKCERCDRSAPFQGKDGLPFLEVHHVVFLSQEGRDTIDNAAALCPNCHREAHLGSDPDGFRSELQTKIERLLP